ncbi:hypothetical protein BC834DRAFT_569945 [Gloeopeniophorella convolvens]|nr:hypothetical protein BC834DRAFT_569945 [Gloeopeniophorella convolvens]
MAPTPVLWLILSDICETFFFGIYTALFVVSTVLLLSKQEQTRTRNLVAAASVTMYVVSATHWAINIALLARAVRNNSVVEISVTPIEMIVTGYVPSISCVLGDAIVVWRAWVLWERRSDLFIPPILFLIGVIATTVTSSALVFKSKSISRGTWQEDNIMNWLGWLICGFTVLTNLWATGLICVRAWQHRRFLRSLMGKSTPRTRAEKALAFLIESGVIYLCIWVVYIVVSLASPGGEFVLSPFITQIVGMYPTVIVIVVTMRLSTADVLSQASRSEQLAPTTPIVHMSRSPQPVSFHSKTPDTNGTASSQGDVLPQRNATAFTMK